MVGQGELTGLVENPVILSSDQSNTTAFKLFNGKGKFETSMYFGIESICMGIR